MSDQSDSPKVALVVPAENLTEADISRSVSMLKDCGFGVDLVGQHSCEVQLLHRDNSGTTTKTSLPVALTIDQVDPEQYHAVALPASVTEEGSLAVNAEVLNFVQDAQQLGKPLICLPDARVPSGTPSRVFSLKRLLADSWRNWNAIDAPRLGAALAYYTLLSLAPLVLLMVAIPSLLFPRASVQSGLLMPIRELMGNEVETLVRSVLDNARTTAGFVAGSVSVVILLIGASGVFLELRDSLDTVWGVKPRYGTGLWSLVRERAFAFMVIIGAGLALLIFFSISTILSAPTHLLLRLLPSESHAMQALVVMAAFAVMTLVFAFIYKVIPDISLRWGDVWIGALITSLLFTIGKLLLSLYLGRASIGSPYAAAGSIVVFLTWVYYSAQIFLLGAEFTHLYTMRHGSHSNTAKHHRRRLAQS